MADITKEIYNYFLETSKEVFYFLENGAVTKNEPEDFSPDKYGYMFTVETKTPNRYLLVFDFDGEGFTERMFNIAKLVKKKWDKVVQNGEVFFKPSPIKGVGLGFYVNFTKDYPEDKQHLLLLQNAYEIYLNTGLNFMGVGFGKRRVDFQTHGIDTAMFERNRKFRGVCTRFNGKFSIFLKGNESYTEALKKIETFDSYFPEIGEIYISEDSISEEIRKMTKYQIINPSLYERGVDYIKNKKVDINNIAPNNVDIRMTEYIKRIVNREVEKLGCSHINHEMKRWVVEYLYDYCGVKSVDNPVEFIYNWIVNNTKWTEIEINNENITKYQIDSVIKSLEMRKEDINKPIGLPYFVLEGYYELYEKEDLLDIEVEDEKNDLLDIEV